MSEQSSGAEWYYVGHYGQLGPLTLEQMTELASDGVIDGETFVWRTGMSDWTQARQVSDLKASIGAESEIYPSPATGNAPPPAPVGVRSITPASPTAPSRYSSYTTHSQSGWQYIQAHAPKSDKKRVAGGLLNFIPGLGRLYLGYMAHGVLQIVTVPVCGAGLIWAWIDAVYILAGGVRLDGYGRRLDD